MVPNSEKQRTLRKATNPPKAHTNSSWVKDWRNFALSAGFMKIPAPMIAPLTIMAASKALSRRLIVFLSYIIILTPSLGPGEIYTNHKKFKMSNSLLRGNRFPGKFRHRALPRRSFTLLKDSPEIDLKEKTVYNR